MRAILAKHISTKSLICQIIIVNKATNFQNIFPQHFAKNSVSVWAPTNYEHALHVHAKYIFDNEQLANRQVAVQFLFTKMEKHKLQYVSLKIMVRTPSRSNWAPRVKLLLWRGLYDPLWNHWWLKKFARPPPPLTEFSWSAHEADLRWTATRVATAQQHDRYGGDCIMAWAGITNDQNDRTGTGTRHKPLE